MSAGHAMEGHLDTTTSSGEHHPPCHLRKLLRESPQAQLLCCNNVSRQWMINWLILMRLWTVLSFLILLIPLGIPLHATPEIKCTINLQSRSYELQINFQLVIAANWDSKWSPQNGIQKINPKKFTNWPNSQVICGCKIWKVLELRLLRAKKVAVAYLCLWRHAVRQARACVTDFAGDAAMFSRAISVNLKKMGNFLAYKKNSKFWLGSEISSSGRPLSHGAIWSVGLAGNRFSIILCVRQLQNWNEQENLGKQNFELSRISRILLHFMPVLTFPSIHPYFT